MSLSTSTCMCARMWVGTTWHYRGPLAFNLQPPPAPCHPTASHVPLSSHSQTLPTPTEDCWFTSLPPCSPLPYWGPSLLTCSPPLSTALEPPILPIPLTLDPQHPTIPALGSPNFALSLVPDLLPAGLFSSQHLLGRVGSCRETGGWQPRAVCRGRSVPSFPQRLPRRCPHCRLPAPSAPCSVSVPGKPALPRLPAHPALSAHAFVRQHLLRQREGKAVRARFTASCRVPWPSSVRASGWDT